MDSLRHYIMVLMFYGLTQAYPVDRVKAPIKSDLKDEKRYPNGTVIGKYIYKDKDGNPVHVKYFADDSSYGLELKSFKVIDSRYPDLKVKQERPETSPELDDSNTKPEKGFELFDDRNPPKPKSEFEIYMQNDLKSGNCGTEKVRVYYDKNNKRKIRHIPYDTFKFCQPF